MRAQNLFRPVWWWGHVLLAAALVAPAWSGAWELSVRQYWKGLTDAVVPDVASPQQKVEAILDWMSKGPQRRSADHPETSLSVPP
ncbi:MAG: hypothetical protein ACHQT6_00925 [Candidatus Acidiferrales bacterium]